MKKTHFIGSLLIASCLLLSGCTASTPSTTTPPKEEESKPIRTLLCGNFLNEFLYTEKEYATQFDAGEYTDNTAPKTRQIELFGQTYDLTYRNSKHIEFTDLSVHIYDVVGEPDETGRVEFDTATGQVVSYFNLPFSHTMNTEEQFVAYIEELLGDQYDLSEYQFNCTTHYYAYFTEPYDIMRSQEVDGFHILAENEKLGSYSFYYTKIIEGYATADSIFVDFGCDSISVGIYDLGYEKDDFADLLNSIDSDSVSAYLRSDVKQGYTIRNVNRSNARLFMKDGIPYLLTTSVITYTKEGSSEQFTTLKQTITGRQ
jgi:hypothetical protein